MSLKCLKTCEWLFDTLFFFLSELYFVLHLLQNMSCKVSEVHHSAAQIHFFRAAICVPHPREPEIDQKVMREHFRAVAVSPTRIDATTVQCRAGVWARTVDSLLLFIALIITVAIPPPSYALNKQVDAAKSEAG